MAEGRRRCKGPDIFICDVISLCGGVQHPTWQTQRAVMRMIDESAFGWG
jgi:hypothetical protein